MRSRNPGSDGHLGANEDRFAVAHPQLGSHGDMSMREQAVGHGAVQQGGDHPAMEASLEAFKGDAAVERGADAAVVVDGKWQSQTEGIGLAADNTIRLGLGPGGLEPGLTELR